MPFETVQAAKLYQQIASQIAELIRSGELKPGDKLPPENDLARRLGVSRGPVREALIALEAGRLIEVRNGSGSYVRADAFAGDPEWRRGFESEPGPFEQFELREILEPEAAFRAASRIGETDLGLLAELVERMDRSHRLRGSFAEGRDFVVTIARASGNSMVAALIEELWQLRGGKLWGTLRERVLDAEHRHAAIEQKKAVLAALVARDAERARQAMRSYLAVTKAFYFGDL